MPTPRLRLSIVIKSLNEEQKIADAIESALAVGKEIGRPVDVIVADSLSSDGTVGLACRYPVRVVQLADVADRGCGAGVQLGFQHALGEYIYLLDGDMKLVPGFMPRAIDALAMDSQLAGIGGVIEDTRIHNDFDRYRVDRRMPSATGEVRWLEGGGLYRRRAIEEAGGYAADRNLKGYEEAELGMRLRHSGWRLKRLHQPAATHTGHALGTLSLLRRHWYNRRAMSAGVLLRGAVGRPWLPDAARLLVHPLATLCWWLCLVPLSALSNEAWQGTLLAAWGCVAGLALLALWMRKRKLRHVVISILMWHYVAAAILLGLFERRVPPTRPILAHLVCDHVQAGIQGAA